MHQWHQENILILAKTYPSPSTRHREITCVAGINSLGQMRRLFPLPYRFLQGDQRFRKWQWISARVRKAPKDHRPESFNIDVDSIEKGEVIPTKGDWAARLSHIGKFIYRNPDELEAARIAEGVTLGIVKPTRITQFQITKSDRPDWTDQEKANLMQESLFDTNEIRDKIMLRKVPCDFYYHYECASNDGTLPFKHKITDWEAGALYWNCVKSHGAAWETSFRLRLESEFIEKKDMFLLLGTIHRFPDQWLVVGMYYPPKVTIRQQQQLDLWS